MKKIATLLVAVLALSSAQAQQEFIQLFTPDAQSLGMGGLSLTNISGSHAIFNNPAASAFSRQKMQLSGSNLSVDDGNYSSVSAFYNFDSRNLFQAGWRRVSLEKNSHTMTFDLGYTRRLNEKWSVGVVLTTFCDTAQPFRDKTRNYALWGDIGVMYSQPLNLGVQSFLRLGGKIGGLGGQIHASNYYPMLNTSAGAALDTFITDAHQLVFGVDTGYYVSPNESGGIYSMAIGGEYTLMQLIKLRAGYHVFNQNGPDNYASVGAGIRFLQIRIDFAYLFANKWSEINNGWSLSFGLDF